MYQPPSNWSLMCLSRISETTLVLHTAKSAGDDSLPLLKASRSHLWMKCRINSEHWFTFSPNYHIRQIFLSPPIPYSFIQLVLHACETTPSKSDNSVKLKCICEGIQKSFSEWGFNFLPDFNFLLQLPCLESLGGGRETKLVLFFISLFHARLTL